MAEKTPYTVDGALLNIAGSTMNYGLTINGGNNEPLVTFGRDGQAEIHHPEKLNDAAMQFINAVTRMWPSTSACQEWIVRKKDVSLFLSVTMDGVDWVSDHRLATRFSRQTDGAIATPRAAGHIEVIPYKDALKFGRVKPTE